MCIGYYCSASAGDGVFMMGDEYVENVQISIDIPGSDKADYLIKISGNSMEPDFYDGDIALVARLEPVRNGDVGIFIVDGGSERMALFKEMLKYLRTRENLSQSELADKLGVAKSTISMYEVGKRQPDFETLEAIADLFNVDMNFLLGKDGSENDRYYLRDETAKAAQEIFENKELRALFDVQRDMDADDLRALHNMALALKRKEHGNDL